MKDSAAAATTSVVPASTGSAEMDTVRGTVLVSGGQRFDQVMLGTSHDSVLLTGAAVPQIARAAGADVWVEGLREAPTRLQVSRFIVRAVNGRPAMDGVLVADGERLFVLTADGVRRPVASAPAGLRQHLGERVWVTAPTGHARAAYGVLQATP